MVAPTKRILFVATSHGQLGSTGKPTGFHFEELTTPYYVFQDAGYTVEFASPKGGNPPYDPGSLAEHDTDRPASVRAFLADEKALSKLRNSETVADVDMSRFDGVYFPGGHGTMWDLPHNSDVAALLREADEQGKVIGAVCHGPAAFVGASGANGEPLVKGRTVNSFTDAEEQAVELDDTVPFLLESKLREEGGDFTKAEKFEACSVADGNLVTGQNPKSAEGVASKMLEVLGQRHSAAAE